MELQAGKTSLEINWWFSRKLEIVLPEHPAIPLLGVYPKDALPCHKNTCSIMFIAALFMIVRSWRQAQMSLNWRMDTEWCCIYSVEYYSTIKNENIINFAGKMDGTRKYDPKWSNPDLKEHTSYMLTDKWILIKKVRIPMIQLTHHRKLNKEEGIKVETSISYTREN